MMVILSPSLKNGQNATVLSLQFLAEARNMRQKRCESSTFDYWKQVEVCELIVVTDSSQSVSSSLPSYPFAQHD